MPPLVRRYVKTSFGFLLAGLARGAYSVVAQFVVGTYPPRLHVTAHVHLLLVGFMLMVVMGVATWMFPRPTRVDRHDRTGLADVVYWVMTISTIERALSEFVGGVVEMPAVRFGIALGGLG